MLVFTRRQRESIFVGDVEVVVVEIRNGAVRLGIAAPKDVPVHRAEIKREIDLKGGLGDGRDSL